MNRDRDEETFARIFETILEEAHSRRPYANYFAWHANKNIQEAEVVYQLAKSLQKDGKMFFRSYHSRGIGNDPPDCEAISDTGDRIGIEATELVDGDAIAAVKTGHLPNSGPWDQAHIEKLLRHQISKKDSPINVKGGPYAQYVLVIYCDEPRVVDFEHYLSLGGIHFGPTGLLDRIFFLLPFNPLRDCCDFIELNLDK